MEGLAGEVFSGNYGNIGSQRSVDSSFPAEYGVEVETEFLSIGSVTAVMKKRSPGPWEMSVQFVVDGEVVREQSTTAEFGVVTLSYTSYVGPGRRRPENSGSNGTRYASSSSDPSP